MEDLSAEQKKHLDDKGIEVIELFDIFLTDGTHLRFNSCGVDLQLLDFVE